MVQPHRRTGRSLVFPMYCMFWEIPARTSIKASVAIQAEITKPRTLHLPTPGHLIVTNFLRATWRGPVQAGKTSRTTDHGQRNHSPYLGQPSDPGTVDYPRKLLLGHRVAWLSGFCWILFMFFLCLAPYQHQHKHKNYLFSWVFFLLLKQSKIKQTKLTTEPSFPELRKMGRRWLSSQRWGDEGQS